MFENMTGTVGFAMHADRLATATKSLRIRETERVAKAARILERQATPRRSYQESMARALVTLATWIAPAAAVPDSPHAGTVRARRRDPRAQWVTGERGARQMLGRIADADRRGNRCRTASTTSTSYRPRCVN